MMQFQVPEGAKPGQTIPVTQPDGQTISVMIPEGMGPGAVLQVPLAPTPGVQLSPANVMVAPAQQQMDRFGEALLIQQEFVSLIELCGIEAKNVYRVYPITKETTATDFNSYQSMFIREESECLERICCSVNRTLTLFVHNGADRNGPTMLKFHKPFHCQGCCCCRPSFHITDGADNKLGRVDDPCIWNCMMEQRVYDHNDQLRYNVEGCCCQIGLCCPCCFDVEFAVTDVSGGPPGKITKVFNGLGELCLQLNKFKVVFPDNATEADKSLLLGSAMLIDLEYFEANKNDN